MTFLFAAGAGGAGGAPLQDLIGGTIVGSALVLIAFAIGGLHRTRRIRWLHRLGTFSERASGLPRWAALPAAIGGAAQILALFGFWWDVATHIDQGRDSGPFGTAAHWPILIGLFGMAFAGFLAVVQGCDEDEPTAVRLRNGWSAPLGGVLLLVSSGFALSGFPLDDTWHRLFGQDVTLWGPTHVLMIGSASLSLIAVWTLLVEGRRSARRTRLWTASGQRVRSASLVEQVRGPSIAGGFLIALSTLQGEFDFGVPQFALLVHPVMMMVAAGSGLVAARIVLGRFGALQAVAFYLVLRVIITAIVDGVFGLSLQHFPLYVAEALLVELAAWRLGTQRPLRLGLAAGALIGTLGLAAEWGWTHVWMPIPWPASLLPEAAILGLAAAVGAAVLGAYLGGTLRDPDSPPRLGPAWVAGVAGAVVLACVAWPLPKQEGIDARAQVTLREVPGPDRTAHARVRIVPAQAADDAVWLTATAWQGGGLVVNRLEEAGPGVFRTTAPLPLHGDWKSLIRLSDGRSLEAIPVYMAADPAIPAAEVPAPASFEREFVSDTALLQREARDDSGWLKLPANLLLALIMGSEIAALAYGVVRLRRATAAGSTAEAAQLARHADPLSATVG
jgi:hypothetical protein